MADKVNVKEKDRLFCFIFGREENKAWTLSLYNAVNGTNHSNLEDIEITTMGDYIYMGMKNDVSFIIGSDISLYEHQSTYNPNMPVRQLMYLGRQYDKYIKQTDQNEYGSKQMILPMPRLAVFYNGELDKGDRVLKLSDSFPGDADITKSDVEVRVHMYNIRPQYKSRLLIACKALSEYSWFVEEVRKNKKCMEIEPAVDKAIKDMPEDYEIKKFLIGNQSEVKNMCITEYNEAETMAKFKRDGIEEGIELEHANTERESKRADAAEKRAAEAEKRIAELEAQLAVPLNESPEKNTTDAGWRITEETAKLTKYLMEQNSSMSKTDAEALARSILE